MQEARYKRLGMYEFTCASSDTGKTTYGVRGQGRGGEVARKGTKGPCDEASVLFQEQGLVAQVVSICEYSSSC